MKAARPVPAVAAVADVVSATHDPTEAAGVRARARQFAEPLLTGETAHSGENLLAHADAVADILAHIWGLFGMASA